MTSLFYKRVLAFVIDYLVIVLYALTILGITLILQNHFAIGNKPFTPINGQIIGFLTLTIPVFLYFYLTEKSKHHATLGKRIMHLVVKVKLPVNGFMNNFLIRNILKFLPWEIAHTGVHWVVFYSKNELNSPIWIWVLLILPQIVVLFYLITIYMSKGESSFYDRIAHTKIRLKI